jgi:hypothetical protein
MSATVFLDILRPGPRADEIVSRLAGEPNASTPRGAETGSDRVEIFSAEEEIDNTESRATLEARLNLIAGDAHKHVAVHYPPDAAADSR